MAKAKKQQEAAISDQVVAEAMKIARATQRPGQSKEQTQLIAKGIEKGIAEYKKQQKAKARAADKAKKKQQQQQTSMAPEQAAPAPQVAEPATAQPSVSSKLAWGLLIISWLGFAGYLFLI